MSAPPKYLPWLALGLGVLLRFVRLAHQPLWIDEAFCVWLVKHPFAELHPWLVGIDQHPPLYYLLLFAWQRLFGDGEFAVRALSAVVSALAMPFFWVTCRRLLTPWAAAIATLALALSPFHTQYAQETRMYALVDLTVAAALCFFSGVLTRRRGSDWAGLIASQLAVTLTHNAAAVFFTLALNLAALGVWRLQRTEPSWEGLRAPRFVWRWLGSQVAVVVLWLPWLPSFLVQAARLDGRFWLSPPGPRAVLDLFHTFHFAWLSDWFPFSHAADVIYAVLFVLGVRALWRTPARLWVLLVCCFAPIIGELLVSLRRPIFYDRTLIWASLTYYMVLAVGLEAALVRLSRRAAIALVTLVLFLNLLALRNYLVYAKKEEWNQVAALISRELQPGEPVLFNATWAQIPFEYYYRDAPPAELRGLPVNLFDRGVLEPEFEARDVPAITAAIAGKPSVWLVYSHDFFTDPQHLIPRELERVYATHETHEFFGVRVIHYSARRE